MKRAYVRPTMVGERFVANEDVAGFGGTKDSFTMSMWRLVAIQSMVSISLHVMPVVAYQEMYIKNLMGSLDSRKVMVYLDMEEMNG
nr:hypothetical protein [uncultured Blautia sp.]